MCGSQRKELISRHPPHQYTLHQRYTNTHISRVQVVTGVKLASGETLSADRVILAPGHSARDTYTHLRDVGVPLRPKDFAMGFRIEHEQAAIDGLQYGKQAAALVQRGQGPVPVADYSLSFNASTKNDRVRRAPLLAIV